MALGECYFDETGSDGASKIFAVAGAAFCSEHAKQLTDLWWQMLEKWRLSHFHMTDCAVGAPPFEHLTAKERDLAAREAISIIRQTASAFVRVTAEIENFDQEVYVLAHWGKVYEFCCLSIVMAVSAWCAASPGIEQVSYFFEAGAPGESNALFRIRQMMEVPEIRAGCKFGGVAVVEKVLSPLAQAADLITWQVGKDVKRAFEGEPTRKDFAALMEGKPFYGGHLTKEMLRTINQDALSLAAEARLPVEKLPEIDRLARCTPKRGRPR